jgi:hypothetical protein
MCAKRSAPFVQPATRGMNIDGPSSETPEESAGLQPATPDANDAQPGARDPASQQPGTLDPDGLPPGSEEQTTLGRLVLPFTYLGIMLAAAWARAGGLNPATLWYDDVWVAVLTKVSSPTELLDIPAPGPLGFLSVLWVARRLVEDPEISLQLIPFICGLIVIPLAGIAVRRITGSTAIAATAAAIMALNPLIAHYSIFIKHFTIDAVASACLVLLAAAVLTKPTVSRLAWSGLAGLMAFAMSFISVIAGGLLVNLGALVAARREKFQWGAVWPLAAVALGFNVTVLSIYALYLRHIRNPELISYWGASYMPTESVGSALGFMRESVPVIARGALPDLLGPAWPMVFVGFAWLAWKPGRRGLAAFFGLFYLVWIGMSALHMYPFGGDRTDIFSFPVTIVLLCAGLHALTAWHRAARLVAVVAAFAIVAVALLHPPGATYFDVEHDSDIVRELQARARDNDAIVLYPDSGFIVGYYGAWPVAIERTDLIMQGYDVTLRRPGSLTLPHDTLERVAPVLETFLQRGNHQRVFYVAARQKADVIPEPFVVSALEHFGYGVADEFRSAKTSVIVFERARRDRAELGPERVRIDVGEAGDTTYLGTGWWVPERADFAFRWAVDSPAYLVVPLRPPLYLRALEWDEQGGYLLRLHARPFAFEGSPVQAVDIEIDGAPLGRVEMRPEMSSYEVEIPIAALQRNLSEIRFRFAYNISPLEAGVSNDARSLAVLFDTIELIRK